MVSDARTAPKHRLDHRSRSTIDSHHGSDQTHIVSVCVRGRDRHPAPITRQRKALLERLTAELVDYAPVWPSIDAVLLPGGFFRLDAGTSCSSHEERPSRIAEQKASRALTAASTALDEVWPGVALVAGLDTPRLSEQFAGDELSVAWIKGAIVSHARKAFPVRIETSGYEYRPNRHGDVIWAEAPALWFDPADANHPQRLLTLRNGCRALLLSCYDAFAARAAYAVKHLGDVGLRYIRSGHQPIRPSTSLERADHIRRWRSFLRDHPPDLGLVAIHLFTRPGADNYWQRHGITGASAALNGIPIIGAAHFAGRLPDHIRGVRCQTEWDNRSALGREALLHLG